MIRSRSIQAPWLWLAAFCVVALMAGSGVAEAQDVDLDHLGSRGFVIVGISGSGTGALVSGAGMSMGMVAVTCLLVHLISRSVPGRRMWSSGRPTTPW